MTSVAIIPVMAPFSFIGVVVDSKFSKRNDWLILRVGSLPSVYPVGLIRELRVRLHSLKGKLLYLGGRVYPIRASTILSFS